MSSEESTISDRLVQAEKTGSLDGLVIEIWRGGGLPPPFYKSDQLRLLALGPQDFQEFASLHFDSKFDPPAVQDKWVSPASPALVKEAAHLVLSLKLLGRKFPEESNPGVADVLSYEVIITANKVEVKRRYYGNLSDALLPLKAFVDRQIIQLKSSGPSKLFHKGQEVIRQ